MIKVINTTGGTLTANATIPFVLDQNTNQNTSFSNNTISINKAGHYDIKATFNVTATATTTNIGLQANGTTIPEANITLTSTVGDNYEIVINDIERVIRQYNNTNKVELTFVTTTGATIVNANASVIEIR